MSLEANSLPPIRLLTFDQDQRQEISTNTLADLRFLRVEEFISARSLSAKSQKAYRRELERFMDWTDRPWTEVTPRHITQFKDHLQQQELPNTSVNRALATLKSFFSWLSRAYPETMQHNPTPSVSLEKVPLPPPRDLSEVELLHPLVVYPVRGILGLLLL
jgi:integrase/recombinase XerD